jgi:hypothetical protein
MRRTRKRPPLSASAVTRRQIEIKLADVLVPAVAQVRVRASKQCASSPGATKRYVHASAADLKEAIAKLHGNG